jgi:hypothetical protein
MLMKTLYKAVLSVMRGRCPAGGAGQQQPALPRSRLAGAHAQGSLGLTGSGAPHNKLQPYLALSFIIALEGTFPSRN